MNKLFTKIAVLFTGTALSFGFVLSLNSKESNKIAPVEASVGNYSRNLSTYYTSAFSHKVTSSMYGTTLLNTLHELMYDTHGTYNTYDDLGTYTKYTDYDIDNPDNIILLYSRQSVDGTATWSSWNREHVWCQSLAFYSTETGAGSDIHHLRPASSAYNSKRSNSPYGIVSLHNSTNQFGDTDCYLANSIFEPADYLKGDVARILMYMYTHYSNEVSGTSTKSGSLSITNIVSTNAGTAQAAWDLLMEWNELDPVDYSEIIRNNQACVYTGNFNPFIDHPEFARMIWDDTSSQQSGLFFTTSYATVSVGSTVTNTAAKYGNITSSEAIVYSSDNPNVATVNSSGVVTGVSNGIARIKARATINGVSKISYSFIKVGSGYTPKYTLNASGVVYVPTSATTARASATIGSETVSFNNTYTTAKYHTQLTNGKVATMTINNFPKTIKSIILSMHSNKSSGSCSISVTVGGSTYKSISTSSFSSIYGSYSESYVPIDVTNSSASVKTGTIVITISCSANSVFFEKAIIDYTERTVTKATNISVVPSSISLTPNEDNFLTTSFTPSSTTLQTTTWSSSNTNIATVNKYGLVRAIAKGTATITATAADGSGVSGSMTVNVVDEVSGDDPVEEATLSSISLNTSNVKTQFSLNESFTYSGLVVTAHYSNSTTSTVTPTSVSSPNMSTTGNKTVAVSYTEGGVTKTANYTINVSSTPSVNSVTVTPSALNLDLNGTTTGYLTATVSVNNGASQAVTWSSSNTSIATVNSSGVVTAVAKGTATITAISDFDGTKSDSCTVTVVNSAESSIVTDLLVRDTTGATSGNTYIDWSNKTLTSDAVYAGNSAGGNESIQLRTTNSNSGVITTASGGTVKKVTVVWNSNTQNGRTINIYGKNTAYSAASDLFGSSAGTLLGSISYGTGTELTISGNYTFIGIKSSSGALYLTSISIQWETGGSTPGTTAVTGVTLNKSSTSLDVGDAESLTATVAPDDATDKSVSWSSDDESVATVSGGTVTAVGVGTATITVTTTDGGFTATCSVTVASAAPVVSDSNYVKITSTSEIKDGYKYVIAVNISGSYYPMSNTFSTQISSTEAITVTNNIVITNSAASSYAVTFIVNNGNVNIYNGSKYLGHSSGTSFNSNTTVDTASTWTISTASTGGTFEIRNNSDTNRGIVYRQGSYNRFAPYNLTNVNGSEYYNVELFREYKAADYAEEFLSTVTCDGGVTPPSTSNWSTMNTKYGYLSSGDQGLLQEANANQGGNIIEQAMARYDKIISRYTISNYTDFIGRSSQNANSRPVDVIATIDFTTIVVVVIAVGALAAFGGYFFFKRRKPE